VSRKDRGYPTVHFKLTPMQRFLPLLGGVVGLAGVELYFWLADGLFEPLAVVAPMIGVLIGTGINIMTGSPSLVLTPWTAEVTRLNQRIVWWPDVREIRVERRGLVRVVTLYEYNGRRTRLRAPITGFLMWDRDFEQKYHAIGHWWLEHRLIEPAAPETPLSRGTTSTS
jgi:hypothetical protein